MKFGFGPIPAVEEGADPDATVARALDLAALADEEGFDSVWFEPGDQLSGRSVFPLAAAAARRTTGVRLVACPFLGLTHPLYIAEDMAALDLLSHGRAVLAPLGRPSDQALAAYRLSAEQAASRAWETIEVLQKAWTPEPFRHTGEHWTIPARLPEHTEAADFSEVFVTPQPAQATLPVWAPAVHWQQAARFGLPVVAGPDLDDGEVGELLERHAAEAPPVARRLRIALRDVHVAETDAAAAAALEANGLDAAVIARAVHGSVDTVVERLEALRAHGVDYLVCRLALPSLDEGAVRDSMLLFARGAAPRMRMFGFPRDIRVKTAAECADPVIGYLADEGVS